MNKQKQRQALLAHCDERLHFHIDKVLQRLPRSVREDEILGDLGLRIISFSSGGSGQFIEFAPPADYVIALNEVLLAKPESELVHAIAHEIAHKVALGRRESKGLHEMQAEDLVIDWGFQNESAAANYHRPKLERMGFDVGYAWAMNNDSACFEEYYDEWNEGRLSPRRYRELHYEADTTSILYCMGCLEEDSQNTSDETLKEDSLVDDGSLDKGIIAGIMCALREKKTKMRAAHIGDAHFEFLEQLRRVHIEIGKLFPTSVYSGYGTKLPNLGQAYHEIGDLLDEVKQG